MSARNHPLAADAAKARGAEHSARELPAAGGLAFRSVAGEMVPDDELLRIICDRIRAAARHLKLSTEDLRAMFSTYRLFEAEVTVPVDGTAERFPIVEAHHHIQGKIGKGALKIMLPRDLIREGPMFVEAEPRVAEVIPPAPGQRWASAGEAWEAVKHFLRELITGETLSMSLKSQATGTPFAGSEGVILCALGDFDRASGRFFLKPATRATEADQGRDKELLEGVMNATAELLTRAGNIAHDRIVHAAETNSTLTARLNLQLPANVVEGHLRSLLEDTPGIVIGDEDMTARLRRILAHSEYRPTHCALAREAARMQRAYSVLMPGTRERLQIKLSALPADGLPSPEQFRDIVSVFFGSGETQQNEDQVFHYREPILKDLSAALTAGPLEQGEDARILALYLRVLLDHQWKMMKAALLNRMRPDEVLPVDWINQYPLLSVDQEAELAALLPETDMSKAEVKRRFTRIHGMLGALRGAIPAAGTRYAEARREVFDHALSALTFGGGIMPSVQRLRFFLTPFTYECVTPKLGVVTRKPVDVCGSELRPEAMATGAVYALETVLRRQKGSRRKSVEGLAVAIQGLGNAGKGVARLMHDRGARIVAASDSRGTLIAPAGLSAVELAALLDHKGAGRRLDTFCLPSRNESPHTPAQPRFLLHRNSEALTSIKADVLVLTAKAASLDRSNVTHLSGQIVCELTGAAITHDARQALQARGVFVIPDNLGSSGGLLVSLSEMLQNSFGQQWERTLEETVLRQQIEQSHDATTKLARKHGVDFATASDILALQRIHALAVYREQLEAASRQLKEQIEAIGERETVLILSDDDEDGVASAAILRGMIARLHPGREHQVSYVNESLRSRTVLDVIAGQEKSGWTVRRVFVLDRSFPLSATGQQVTADLARRCRVTLINNHELPEEFLQARAAKRSASNAGSAKSPGELGVLLISPQTLKATWSSRHFTTALVLREIAHQLLHEPAALARLDWQAAIGSCLDVTPETSNEWLLFYAQFNPDQMMEAARAVRMVARAHGFMSAIHALEGVDRPDQLETSRPWLEFIGNYHRLAERVQLLVEKIVMENVGRPYVSHHFTATEVASPVAFPGGETRGLDLYSWISELLTRQADFSEKPIIVGQVVRDVLGREYLGVRIRSPRGVELMEVGLPEEFRTGGLPNTAVARIALKDPAAPEPQFQALVESLWWKTVSPMIELKKAAPQSPSKTRAKGRKPGP